MNYLRNSKLFAVLIGIISIGIIIRVFASVDFVFYPINALFESLFPILLITGFLYYIFLPIYDLLDKKIDNDAITIPIILALIILIIYFMISAILPEIINQISSLISITPSIVNNLISSVEQFVIDNNITNVEVYNYLSELDLSVTNIVTNILDQFTAGFTNILSLTISSLVIIATVPLVLIYMFKESHKIPENVLMVTPHKYKTLIGDLLSAFHVNAKNYIGGRVLICVFVGVCSYFVYLFLGLPNALLFGLFCAIADMIPYFGPFIGAAPAFFVALSMSPMLALGVVVFITIIQQIESYVFTPFVMGNSLDLHPVTVVVLVIFAKDAFGILGMILILPAYSIIKGCALVIIRYLRDEKGFQFKYE